MTDATEIISRCEADRAEAIAAADALRAKERAEGRDKEPRYGWLIEKARKLGRDDEGKQDEESIKLLQEAADMCPTKTTARWGLATVFHFAGRREESLAQYDRLIADHPDDEMVARWYFEKGSVLIAMDRVQEGLQVIISEAMSRTQDFDGFWLQIAKLYEQVWLKKSGVEILEKARAAAEEYNRQFPHDPEAGRIVERLAHYGEGGAPTTDSRTETPPPIPQPPGE